jgi:hypothetical protein
LDETLADIIVRETLEAQAVSALHPRCSAAVETLTQRCEPLASQEGLSVAQRRHAQRTQHCLSCEQDDLEKRMKEATSEPEQHVHGHEHDICCGASKGEVEGSE